MNAQRPHSRTPDLVARGWLQPSNVFILPAGVVLGTAQESAETGLATAIALDGRVWAATDSFPQNEPGDVVQVVHFPAAGMAYARYRDGGVYAAGRWTQRAAKRVFENQAGAPTCVFVGKLTSVRSEKVALLDAQGTLYLAEPTTGNIVKSSRQAPAGVVFTAIGEDPEGRWCARDRDGNWLGWSDKLYRFEKLEARPEGVSLPLSLDAHGDPGTLWVKP